MHIHYGFTDEGLAGDHPRFDTGATNGRRARRFDPIHRTRRNGRIEPLRSPSLFERVSWQLRSLMRRGLKTA